jgi:hypothetical protein
MAELVLLLIAFKVTLICSIADVNLAVVVKVVEELEAVVVRDAILCAKTYAVASDVVVVLEWVGLIVQRYGWGVKGIVQLIEEVW